MASKRVKTLETAIFCFRCRNWTRPEIVACSKHAKEVYKTEKDKIYNPEGDEVIIEQNLITEYYKIIQSNEILMCAIANCRQTFLRTYDYIEGSDSVNNENIIPKSPSWHRRIIDNPKENEKFIIPEQVYYVYCEATNAYNWELYTACGFLVGAILEAICIYEKVKEVIAAETTKLKKEPRISLYDMLEKLIDLKKFDNDYSILLNSIRKFRNATVHEITIPIRTDLHIILESIEDLLLELYLEDYLKRERRKRVSEHGILISKSIESRKIRR